MIRQGKFQSVGAIPVADGRAVLAAGVQTDGTRLFALGDPVLVDAAEVSAGSSPAALFEDMLAASLDQAGEVDLCGIAWSLEDESGLPDGVDVQILAEALGHPLVAGFAGADVRAGGVGRCLDAPFFHALAGYLGLEGLTGFIKLETRATLYLVDPAKPRFEDDGAVMVVECGPGIFGGAAGQGSQNGDDPLEELLACPHFSKMPPKWLADGDLQALNAAVGTKDQSDTLCAAAVGMAIESLEQGPARLILCGEGADDRDLVRALRASVGDVGCDTAQAAGCDTNLLQANALGHIAARVARGLVTSVPATTGCSAPVGGGDVFYPRGEG